MSFIINKNIAMIYGKKTGKEFKRTGGPAVGNHWFSLCNLSTTIEMLYIMEFKMAAWLEGRKVSSLSPGQGNLVNKMLLKLQLQIWRRRLLQVVVLETIW